MAKPATRQNASNTKARTASTFKPTQAVPKLNFGIRIRAWWEGYDATALQAHLIAKVEASKSIEANTNIVVQTEMTAEVDVWNESRVEVAQMVWGREYCGPGGPDYIIAMSKLLALTPEMSMVDLAAGLGGPARVLAEHFGVWVSGYEMSQALVDAGNALSLMAGKAKKAALSILNINLEQPFDRRFDRALANGFLTRVENKSAMLKKIVQAMKPESMILINDFFARDTHVLSHPDMEKWLSKESQPLYFSTSDQTTEMLEALGLEIRVNETISQEYISLVTNAWRNADKLVAQVTGTDSSAAQTKQLFNEAELWAKRLELLKSKHIEVRRIVAIKKIGVA